jgi:hypothetical protein
MSIEDLLIARLTGQGETGDSGQHPLSAAQSRALSWRLREVFETGEPGSIGLDRGAAADAMQLAAYLAGSLAAAERAAFERNLAESPDRREALLSAAAWLDRLATMQDEPSAAAFERGLALDPPAPPPRPRWQAAAEWLLPGPRLAIATSALATLAIAAVGLDIAMHLSPSMQPTPPPGITAPAEPPPMRTILPSDSMLPPAARTREPGRAPLTAESINAINAYLERPEPQRLQDLLTTLARAGAGTFAPGSIHKVALAPEMAERLRQRAGRLPTSISASLSMDGTLRLEAVD